MKFSKKVLETFVNLPSDWRDLMEDIGLEIKSEEKNGNDVIFNLELLANRGDHYCYAGIAREIYGRTGNAFKEPGGIPVLPNDFKCESGAAGAQYIQTPGQDHLFDLETDKCIAFSLTPYKLNKTVQTSKDHEYMLTASDINIIHPAIDVTNVIMLEMGQPAHVYDADKIVGKIRVRESRPGEMAALLFHEGKTELPPGTVVIADDQHILSVGGVIGCHGATVDKNTKNILFEAALFDPISVRKTARALGLATLAGQRFERGGDIAAICSSAARANKLYPDIGWQLSGQLCFARTKWIDKKHIDLPGDFVRRELEINISDAEIAMRLARYGFEKTDDEYHVPTWRVWDIKGERADLIEELARSIGYDNLPSKLPPMEIGAALTAVELRKAQIDSYLVHNGFFEVLTDNLYSPRHANLSPVSKHIKIANSIEGGYSFMKNNTIIQAVELVEKNLRVKNREIRAYEWGRIFLPDGKKTPVEHNMLWGVTNGVNESALTIKGLIQNLTNDLGLNIELGMAASEIELFATSKYLHPNRRATVFTRTGKDTGNPLKDKVSIGIFGEIHPILLAQFDIKNDTPVYFEFFADSLLYASARTVKYQKPPAIIPSTRDITVPVPYGRHAGDVTDYILETFKEVSSVKITDVFEKPKDGIRNVTYLLEFSGQHGAEVLNALILEIMRKATEYISK